MTILHKPKRQETWLSHPVARPFHAPSPSISRILYPQVGGDHLSGIAIAGNLYQPTPSGIRLREFERAALPAEADRSIFGFSTREVYPTGVLPQQRVSFYLTFSPSLRLRGAVILCGTVCNALARTPCR